MSSSTTSKRVLSAVAGMCAIAAFSFPATALAQNLNRSESVQSYASNLNPHHFAYGSDTPAAVPAPRSSSIKARARRLLKGENGPLMYCDKDGYRCDPNPAYYGDSAYQYEPYPYYYYADGFTNSSFPNVPSMGGF
ncbi:MAG TPA: hypothetical protein VMV13_10195 [Candidatus Binataceae bacterium]|nr:hypothetical protein [Candidatus Binataceae bacterium]